MLNNNNIQITVIIPVFNSEKTVLKAIESVEKQTSIENIKEIIVVNDGSTDSSKEILNSYSKICKIPLIILDKKNGGVSSARNLGIKKASGNWIAFLDSDDYWYPNKIEKQVNAITINPKIKFLGTDYSDYNHKKGRKYLPFSKYQKIYNLTIYELCIKNYPATPSIIIEKDLADKVGLFNEEMRYGEDINYFQKFSAKYQNYYILSEPLVFCGIQKIEKNEGLSSNFKSMNKSNYKNLKEMYEGKYIGSIFYSFCIVLYKLKYFYRLIKKMI